MVKLLRTIFIFWVYPFWVDLLFCQGWIFRPTQQLLRQRLWGGFDLTAEAVLAGLLTDFPAVT
ncbi:MAG: hypothetical protein M0Z83_08775 [Betaproteobacteria bacterium]|nr:hypothetical protein [Betaproteobacteria bacterium]